MVVVLVETARLSRSSTQVLFATPFVAEQNMTTNSVRIGSQESGVLWRVTWWWKTHLSGDANMIHSHDCLITLLWGVGICYRATHRKR